LYHTREKKGAPVLATTEEKICAVLRGEAAEAAIGTDPADFAHFVEAARDHGVLPLLDAELRSRDDRDRWPLVLLAACRQAARDEAIVELAHRGECVRVLGALHAAKIDSLLIKGAGLAYGCYADALLRPRVDTDVLVTPKSAEAACRVLEALGYRRVSGPAGEFVGYQVAMHRRARNGVLHALDLHWRVSDWQSFAWLISFAELYAAALMLPPLGAAARRPGNAHALLIALVHRAGDIAGSGGEFADRLIWLYDMKLLAETMSESEMEDFGRLVDAKRLGAIALDGLCACMERFRSRALAGLIEALERSPRAGEGATFLGGGRFRREWIEWRAIPQWRMGLVYLSERLVPAREYMRERYPDAEGASLPALHLRRWIEGVSGLMRAGRGP